MADTTWAIDAMEGSLDRNLIPAGTPVLFAYKTGTTQNPDIAWTETDLAGLPQIEGLPIPHIYRVHQGFGSRDSFRTADGVPWDEIDMEAGAWDVPSTLRAIRDRNGSRWSTRVYASDSPWADLANEAMSSGVSLRSVFWREANWSLTRAEARRLVGLNRRYAVQWASPTSNPTTLVPGTSVTLRTANLDLNETGLLGTGWQG